MLLEIKNITVYYGKIKALTGVSIGLEKGDIISLIGSNGAGKTTVLRTISGLMKTTMGEVWFQGRRIDGLPPHTVASRGISHVPEGRGVFAQMTAYENLKLGAYLRKNSVGIKSDIENIYSRFPILKERSGQPAGSLSGGEQQILAIARGLMAKPIVMLLDEPTLGLAPMIITEIGRIIQAINQQGVDITLVEQNAFLALNIARRCYVMETGKVVLEGDAKDLINNEQVRKAYLGG